MEEAGLPAIVGAVATRARSSRTSTHVATRVRGTSGRWLRVTAVPLEGGDGHVAVMIEPARPADLTPILLESYGLTEREVEIVMLLARGLATKEIAAELSLSSHTVRDHVKAIFEKVGVNSRGELVACLFSKHLLDGFHEAVDHVTESSGRRTSAPVSSLIVSRGEPSSATDAHPRERSGNCSVRASEPPKTEHPRWSSTLARKSVGRHARRSVIDGGTMGT